MSGSFIVSDWRLLLHLQVLRACYHHTHGGVVGTICIENDDDVKIGGVKFPVKGGLAGLI